MPSSETAHHYRLFEAELRGLFNPGAVTKKRIIKCSRTDVRSIITTECDSSSSRPAKKITPRPSPVCCRGKLELLLPGVHNREAATKRRRSSESSSEVSSSSSLVQDSAVGSTTDLCYLSPVSTVPNIPLVMSPLCALEDKKLWTELHGVGNEMIVNKSGRRMFPELSVSVKGLNPMALYSFCLDTVPVASCTCPAEALNRHSSPQGFYVHPDSPQPGLFWMRNGVNFKRLKLGKCPGNLDSNTLVMKVWHKYQPRLHIFQEGICTLHPSQCFSFIFSETQFTAVTSYQSPQVRKLKVKHNPLARGSSPLNQSRPVPDG